MSDEKLSFSSSLTCEAQEYELSEAPFMNFSISDIYTLAKVSVSAI